MVERDNDKEAEKLDDIVRKNQGHPHFPLSCEYDRVAYEYGKGKGYYHYDIMWSKKIGYFNTEEEARQSLDKHLANYGYRPDEI